MAHQLNFGTNGKAALFLADEGAWHNLGTIVNGARSWKEAIEIAQLDWTVSKRQLEINGELIPAWGTFRDDLPGARGFLGAVGAVYTPIQNEYCFSFVDAILGAEDGCHYETAGALGNGERVWCMARIPHDFKVDGQDPHRTYLLFATSHDGSLAATCRQTTVRVVCYNTLTSALNINGGLTRIKHTAEAQTKLNQAKKLLANAAQGVKDVAERLTMLSHKMLTRESMTTILDRVFPEPKGTDKNKLSTRRENIMADVLGLFESNDNNAFPDFRGTAYNLLNAITEYTDHTRSTRITQARKDAGVDMVAARTESAWLGAGAALKNEAMEVIYEVAQGCTDRPYKSYITRAIENGQAERGEGPPASLLDDILSNAG